MRASWLSIIFLLMPLAEIAGFVLVVMTLAMNGAAIYLRYRLR